MSFWRSVISFLAILVASVSTAQGARAATIEIGSTKIASGGPIYITLERGYFTAEGFGAELVFFPASLPVAVAVVSGDIDFGSAGLTAVLYSLGGQGAPRENPLPSGRYRPNMDQSP